MTRVFQVSSSDELDAARALIREYGDSLGVDLSFQGFATELANLPGDFAPPRGRLLLAECEREIAGCVALRPRAADVCEMKRLYVRPRFRGRRLGHLLATTLIVEARALGYRRICLDSLPFMRDAVRLYASLGFAPCAPYDATPIAGTVFMALPLQTDHRAGERA